MPYNKGKGVTSVCGRYQLMVSDDQLYATYDFIENRLQFNSLNEVYPSNQSLIINNMNQLELVEWGFTMSGTSKRIINSRAETIDQKPLFKESFNSERCLIVASGFYEWKKTSISKEKKLIELKDEPIFVMAGIKQKQEETDRFSIVTKASNDSMLTVHHRMPVILTPQESYHYLHGTKLDAMSLLNKSDPDLKINPLNGVEMLSLF